MAYKPAADFSNKPYNHVPLQPVDSSQVSAIGYSMDSGTLAVTFARGPGHVYQYPNVSPELHAQFLASDSKGTFHGQHLKTLPFDKYPAEVLQASAAPVEAVTPESIAAKLSGVEYPLYGADAIFEEAKSHGIVIVFGGSDDLMELRGAIHDEFNCYEGGAAKMDAKGVLRDWESVQDDGDQDEIADWLARSKTAKEIKAVFSPSEPAGATWAYETAIPYATFDVMEGDEIYCRGIVFKLADLSS